MPEASGDADQKWDDVIRSWGYDPELYELDGDCQVKSWNVVMGGEVRELRSYKGNVRLKQKVDAADIDEMIKSIRAHRPSRGLPAWRDAWFVTGISDCQIGKGENGGSRAIAERFLDCLDQAVEEFHGSGCNKAVIILGGDAIENACGMYSGQPFQIDLNRRQQMLLALELHRRAIIEFARIAERVLVMVCDDNHGENRQGGSKVTDDSDNANLELGDTLQMMFSHVPAFSHVDFEVGGEVAMCELDGVKLAVAHGHRASRGNTAQQKQLSWWEGQAFGNQPVGDARILVTGHYHHFSVVVDYGRTHIQLMTLDGGSRYFKEATGKHAPAGVVTFMVGQDLGPLGWDRLRPIYPRERESAPPLPDEVARMAPHPRHRP